MSILGHSRITGRLSALLFTLYCLLFSACGGSGSSSTGPEPLPEPAAENVLLFQAGVIDGVAPGLHLLDRRGNTRLLSGDASGYSVSPDSKWVAYWHGAGDTQTTLVITALDSTTTAQTRIVMDGSIPQVGGGQDWLLWLPDSRRVLYATNPPGSPTALWLASAGDGNPVKLIEAEPGTPAYMRYTASFDGSRVAVVINYLEGEPFNTHVGSADLFLLAPGTATESRLVDGVSDGENTLAVAWSPAANELIYYRRPPMERDVGASGALQLLAEDGTIRLLRAVITRSDDKWLDADRILAVLETGFEVIGRTGSLLASHDSAITSAGTESGAASIAASPDGRWLAFLDWTDETTLDVYLLDLSSGQTSIVGPASSIPYSPPRPFPLYYESELYWSADSTWLAWDRQTLAPVQEYVHTVEVGTGQAHPIPPGAKFNQRTESPWLPEGNVLEYRLRLTEGDPPFYGLMADDLDSGYTLFAEPYPMPGFTVTDPDSGQSMTATSYELCQHTWLTNDALLWNGCDENAYLSRIVDGGLDDTELISRSASPPALVSNNRQIVLMPPYSGGGHWLMYDYPARQLTGLKKTYGYISTWSYTFLM